MPLPDTPYANASRTALGPLTDFTVIVNLANLPSTWWDEVDTSDGTKGRASKEDLTELPVDWISFNDVAETGWARVKWSGTLSGAGANTIRVYPPKAANASVASGDAFGSDNAYDVSWKLYLPLDEAVNNDVDGYKDRTVNANHGTGVSMALTEVAGQVGNAQDFDGLSDHIAIGDDATLEGMAALTLSAWIKPGAGTSKRIFDKKFDEVYALFHTNTTLGFALVTNTDSVVDASCGSIVLGTLNQVVATWSAASGLYECYIDGVASGSGGSLGGATVATNAVPMRLGENHTGGNNYVGLIDEAQIHSDARSSDWIAEAFASEKDNATYWGAWTFVDAGAPPSFDDDVVELTVIMAQQQALEVVMAQEEDLEVVMAQEEALTVVI